MAFLRHNLVRFFLAILTLSVFAGDLIADAIPDGIGTSMVQNSRDVPSDNGSCPDQGSCPDCCAVHGGAAIVSSWAFQLAMLPTLLTAFTASNEHAPSGDPVPIEYPPRLA